MEIPRDFPKYVLLLKHDSKATQFYSPFNFGFCENKVGNR